MCHLEIMYYLAWICSKCLEEVNMNYPKFWFNGDLPWYNPLNKPPSKQIQDYGRENNLVGGF